MIKTKKLLQKIKKIPKKPGIYFFKDKNEKIIYIGKALSLKNRVSSYFKEKIPDKKTQVLVSQISDFGFQVVSSEFDALLLEAKLIKEHQPKYNIRLKDNKRYLYIAITQAPYRIFPVRRPDLEKNLLDWFGPFPSSKDIKMVLRFIRRSFPYCSEKKVPKKECFYKHLGLCPGFKNLQSKTYKKQIQTIRKIFQGKGSNLLIKNLENKMWAAAKKNLFEEAQKYKNQLLSLQRLTQGWQNNSEETKQSQVLSSLRKIIIKYQNLELPTIHKIEAYDIANLGSKIIVGAMVVFLDGLPEKSLYRKFNVSKNKTKNQLNSLNKLKITPNDPADLASIIDRRLNHPDWLYPQLILVDGGKSQISAAFKILKKRNLNNQIAILGLAKKQEELIIPFIKDHKIVKWHSFRYQKNNPVLKLLQQLRDEAHRFSQKYYHLLSLVYLKKRN